MSYLGGDAPIKLVMNGWYMNRPSAWPPNPRYIPLVTSFHISQHRPSRSRFWRRPAARVMLSAAGIAVRLQGHAPIGARDQATLALLRSRRIDSHYSGCLTLALPARPETRLRTAG